MQVKLSTVKKKKPSCKRIIVFKYVMYLLSKRKIMYLSSKMSTPWTISLWVIDRIMKGFMYLVVVIRKSVSSMVQKELVYTEKQNPLKMKAV